MHARIALSLTAALMIVTPFIVMAEPPAHAPAHGYRAKHEKAAKAPLPAPATGIEVVFDSERGIHVAVGLPGIFFHEGRYYREQDGRWQVSVTGEGGWSFSASSVVPEPVVKAKKRHPGPARMKKKGRGKK